LAVTSCITSPSVVRHHQLEGAREQEIADQHAGLVAPDRVGRGEPAAQVALIHHVVMQERRRVDELDRRGEPVMARSVIAAEPRRGHGQHRPQALAARGDQMTRELRDQPDRALHAREDQRIDGRHVGGGERQQIVQVGPGRLGALLEADDDGHSRSSFLVHGIGA
jgi:hypothetical protein